MQRWQHTIFLGVGNEHLPLSQDEAQTIIDKLRTPDRRNPHRLDEQLSAAVYLERVTEELGARNPPPLASDLHVIGLALVRLEMSDGLTPRQEALRDAILALELGSP